MELHKQINNKSSTINEHAESDESDVSTDDEDPQGQTLKPVILTKELLEHRADHVMYLIDENGKPLDNGSRNLQHMGKIPSEQKVEVGCITTYKRSNNKYYIGLSIRKAHTES